MTSTTLTMRGTLPRAVAIAVAAVLAAGLMLGLLAGALGETGSVARSVAPPAPSVAAVPGAPALPAPSGDDRPVPETAARHVVAAGETLGAIAQRYGVPTELLAADNGIGDPDRIGSGAALTVATPPSNVVVVAAGDTLGGLAERHGTTVADLMALNPQIDDPDRITAGNGLRVAASG